MAPSTKYEKYSREELLEEIARLSKRKKYGLVWEEENKEATEQFEKESLNKFPVLVEETKKQITDKNPGSPTHILIEGDNYHALSTLNYTHSKGIDLIYIDPPYNTGKKDFKYNDKFVDQEDSFRHSKWLNFMSKRLILARKLLKSIGIICISIDDNEQANLKLLCDDIFGENNFIAQLIWEQGKKHIGSFIGVNHEYMLIYARNKNLINDNEKKWRQKKQGLGRIYKEYDKLKKKNGNHYDKIRLGLIEFYKQLPENEPAKRQKHFNWVDEKGIYYPDNISQGTGKGPRYPVIHPETKKPCTIPTGGWRYSFETMQKLLKKNKIHFGEDHLKVPCRKRYLKETEFELPQSVFYKDGRGATKMLEKILKEKKFNNPKDTEILRRIFSFRPNSVILDFFAGSGSTGHAVLELNKIDGGNRQFILCTNNENHICTDVCHPRIKKVMTGFKTSKGKIEKGLGGNLKYYKTAFVSSDSTHRNKKQLTEQSIQLICVKESTFEEVLSKKDIFIFKNNEKYTAILLDELKLNSFKSEISKLGLPVSVYIFSLEADDFSEDFDDVKQDITFCSVPEAILKVYLRILKTTKHDYQAA